MTAARATTWSARLNKHGWAQRLHLLCACHRVHLHALLVALRLLCRGRARLHVRQSALLESRVDRRAPWPTTGCLVLVVHRLGRGAAVQRAFVERLVDNAQRFLFNVLRDPTHRFLEPRDVGDEAGVH